MSESYWSDKNVFVTGAPGLLGSALVKELVNQNATVVALIRDRVPSSPLFDADLINNVTVINGALEDYFVVERALNEYEIDTVFHLGAQTIVPTANRSPRSSFESNIKGTWNVLEASRMSPLLKRIVIASTDKVYGSQKKLPYTEDAPLLAAHPYDVSKACADMLAQSYAKTYGLPVGIARCGNCYGPGDLNFNRIIPGTIKSILQKGPPLIRSDGKFQRDYVFIDDIVNAYLVLGEALDASKFHGDIFNFSTNHPYTVLEVVEELARQLGSKLSPKILNEAASEIRDQYLSSDKAKKILHWEPQHSLEAGLKKTIPWYQKLLSH